MSAIGRTWASYMTPQIIPSFSKNTQSEQVHSSSAEILKLLAALLLLLLPFRFSSLSLMSFQFVAMRPICIGLLFLFFVDCLLLFFL
jgi:hypothetical protein